MTNTGPIAERALRRIADGQTVRVEITAPTEVSGHWECEVRVSGLEIAPTTTRGVDSFQALVEAFNAARTMLAESAHTMTWISGMPGDTGLPNVLPYEDARLAALMDTIAAAERQRFYLYAQPFKAQAGRKPGAK
jgi:hypothetical protein